MSTSWARINRILPFSCVDGPGNRFVIFFQGCNLSCLNCHNPYTMNHCNDCAICVDNCQDQALSVNDLGKVVWTESLCTHCDKCIDICPHNASPKIYHLSLDDVIDRINHYLPFLNGITVSGGESTLQLPFIHALFQRIKSDETLKHLTCLVDSNGTLSQAGWEKLLPYMDGAMIDLKAWDNSVHHQLTGRENTRTIKTIEFLAKHNKLQEIRLLLIPNQTDLENRLEDIILFLSSLKITSTIRLNAFSHHGVKGIASHWPSATQPLVEEFASRLNSMGIEDVICPVRYFA